MQKYYVVYSIQENHSINNPTVKKNFINLAKSELNLSLSTISYIRNQITDKFKNISIEELVNKIQIEDFLKDI